MPLLGSGVALFNPFQNSCLFCLIHNAYNKKGLNGPQLTLVSKGAYTFTLFPDYGINHGMAHSIFSSFYDFFLV